MKTNLIHGDCLEKMKDIPDNSVDLILTDPPYGMTSCKWDSVIPFEPMWEQLHRIIKLNGAICLFGSEPFSSFLRTSNIKEWKYDWIWEKERPSNFATAKKQPLRYSENISVFYKKMPTYNPQMREGKPNHSNGKGIKNKPSEATLPNATKSYFHDNGNLKYPKNIIYFIRGTKQIHPTQKPVDLLEYLIYTYTNEGETVLDFTMGSGSTGVACINTNRNFIGIELDDNYFEVAKERIEKTKEENN